MKKWRVKYKNEITAYSIMALPLVWWGVFFIYAFATAVVMSFTNWSLAPETIFTGFENYIRVFRDEIVREAFVNTFIWTAVLLVGVNGFGLLIAFLIKNIKSGFISKALLACMFWPTLVSAAASAEIQKFILGESESGLINSILLKMNFIDQPIAWFSNPDIALWGLMLTPFFLGFGIKMIIYYAGMKNIPPSYYEAAQLETSNKWLIFWKITFPLLRPVLMFNLILSVIEGLKVIAPMQLLTNGGPLNSTNSVILAMYQYGFDQSELGYACAIALVLFVVILALTVVQLRLDKEKISYE